MSDNNNTFTYNYHLDTIKNKKVRRNADNTITTVNVIGIPYKGKIYNVPGYDNTTGLDLDEQQALKKFKKNIEAGEIIGFPIKWKGDIYDHPANQAARIEHKWIERDEPNALRSIGFGKKR